MAKTNELEAAYQATTYRVLLPEGHCDLRINQPSPRLGNLLQALKAGSFAILSAHNPASARLLPAENQQRHRHLQADLRARELRFYCAENVPDDGCWPLEASCGVMGIPLAQASELARKYGQNAIVYAESDGVPRLLWVES